MVIKYIVRVSPYLKIDELQRKDGGISDSSLLENRSYKYPNTFYIKDEIIDINDKLFLTSPEFADLFCRYEIQGLVYRVDANYDNAFDVKYKIDKTTYNVSSLIPSDEINHEIKAFYDLMVDPLYLSAWINDAKATRKADYIVVKDEKELEKITKRK
jgi:hypothetical protein